MLLRERPESCQRQGRSCHELLHVEFQTRLLWQGIHAKVVRKAKMAKRVPARDQKGIDEEFAALVDESIKKDERLLKKLAKA